MKFKSPFTTNELSISQTYHGENASNPNNLSLQCAIDLSKIAGSNVLSVCDGIVELVTPNAGGYISVIPDGASFRILYVHTDRFAVSKGQRVTTGQLLGKIKSINGSHLHFGLKNISGKAPHPQPMDYFDRSLVFTTKYQAIKDVWFTGNNLNWSLFKDLNYNNTIMAFKKGDKIIFTGVQNIRKGSGTSYATTGATTPGMIATIEDEPRVANGYTWYDITGADWVADVGKFKIYVEPPVTPPPPVEPPDSPELIECQKQVKTLEVIIDGLELKLGTCEGQLEILMDSNEKLLEENKEIIDLKADSVKLNAEIKELKSTLEQMDGKYERVLDERNKFELMYNEAVEKINAGSLSEASTGDMFAEIWKRIIRSIK